MKFTKHASQRAVERSVTPADIQAALDWGTEIPQGRGRVALTVDRRALKRAKNEKVDIGPHAGATVVVADDGAFVTVIRSDDVKRLARFGEDCSRRGRN